MELMILYYLLTPTLGAMLSWFEMKLLRLKAFILERKKIYKSLVLTPAQRNL